MTNLEWPGQLGSWARSYSFFRLSQHSGMTNYAPSLMKTYGVSEEELIQAISRLPNLQR